MRNLIIVTRLYADKGGEKDEFVNIWKQNNESDIVNLNCGDDQIILIHGSIIMSYNVASNELSKKIIALIPINLKGDSGLIFHHNNEKETLKKNLKEVLADYKFIDEYSTVDKFENMYHEHYEKLANDPANAKEHFEAIWDFFLGDPILEAKLELLHQCLTPEGLSRVTLKNNTASFNIDGEEINIEFDNISKEKFDILNSLEKEKKQTFHNGYIKALSDFRDELLDG